MPDDRLRVKTKPIKKVTPQLKQIFDGMVKLTLSFVDPEGVGLAATQIGEDGQYFVVRHDGDNFKTYINPSITKYSKAKKLYFEGCLSIPDYWGEITRSLWVDTKYMDEEGQWHEERMKGFDAWVFQHECDHLAGKLFVDHVLEQKAKFYHVVGKDRAGAEIFEEVKI